jgi:hypothetical protein
VQPQRTGFWFSPGLALRKRKWKVKIYGAHPIRMKSEVYSVAADFFLIYLDLLLFYCAIDTV